MEIAGGQSKHKESAPSPRAMQLRSELCGQIRSWRMRLEMTQAELAKKSGTSVSFISMIERAERSPSHQTMLAIAQALEIPVSELFRTPPAALSPAALVKDNYPHKLVDFANNARLSHEQIDQLVAIGQAVFGLPSPEKQENCSNIEGALT